MKILIVDDEMLARERLVGLVSELNADASISEAENCSAGEARYVIRREDRQENAIRSRPTSRHLGFRDAHR